MGFPVTQSIVDAYLLGPFVQVNLKTTCPRDNKKGPFFQALLNTYFKFLTNYTGFLAVTSVILVTLLQLSLNFCLQVCFAKCWYSIHLLHKLPKDWWRRVWWPLGTYERRFYDIICIIFGRYIRNQGGSYQIFLWHLYFLQGGWGVGGMQIQGRHLFKGDNIYFILQNFNHAMWCPWMGHSLIILHVIIVYSMKMNIHLYLTLCEVGGDTHTPAFLSWLSLPPFLLIFSPLFTFTLPCTIWTG